MSRNPLRRWWLAWKWSRRPIHSLERVRRDAEDRAFSRLVRREWRASMPGELHRIMTRKPLVSALMAQGRVRWTTNKQEASP